MEFIHSVHSFNTTTQSTIRLYLHLISCVGTFHYYFYHQY